MPKRDDIATRVHRTWLELLIEANYREVAALVIDAELDILYGEDGPYGISVDIPPSAYLIATKDEGIQDIIRQTLYHVTTDRFTDRYGNTIDNLNVTIRVKLLDIEEDWKEIVKDLIVNAKDCNQGVVTEKLFNRKKQTIYFYNEMKFASRSEIRIAQEFERQQVLFFPLALAVRNDTGTLYLDHREVDFLVCQNGAWGILEVSYHPDRFEKDAEKDAWFKTSGILCIQHYTAERCYNQPSEVVNEFLKILAKYQR